MTRAAAGLKMVYSGSAIISSDMHSRYVPRKNRGYCSRFIACSRSATSCSRSRSSSEASSYLTTPAHRSAPVTLHSSSICRARDARTSSALSTYTRSCLASSSAPRSRPSEAP